MSYIIPAPLIYQQLANAGGVANISPDLNAVIVGPCYNVVKYDGTSAASIVATAATNVSGDAVAGNGTTTIVDNEVNNTFELPSQKVGQTLDMESLKVYFNDAKVKTLQSGFTAEARGSTTPATVLPSASGTATDGSMVIQNVTNASLLFYVDDSVSVTGIGVAGATVSATTITAVTANSVTIAVAAEVDAAAAVITKNALAYGKAVTVSGSSTLTNVVNAALFSVGDPIVIEGGDTGGIADLSVNILSLVVGATAAASSIVVSAPLGASKPSGTEIRKMVNRTIYTDDNRNLLSIVKETETGNSTAGSPVISAVASASTKFFPFDPVIVTGVGPSGDNLETTVVSADATTVTLNDTATTPASGISIIKKYSAYSKVTAAADSEILADVTHADQFSVGDEVTVVGGLGSSDLIANIVSVGSLTVVLSVAVPVNGSLAIYKNTINILNTTSASLRVEDGDTVVIAYTDTNAVDRTFTSTIMERVVTNNIIGSFRISDLLPADCPGGIVNVTFIKTYNNQLVPSTQYDSTVTAAEGTLIVLPTPELVYGVVQTADVHIGYRALRTDIQNTIITITSADEIVGELGVVTDENPLALGVLLALTNAQTQVLALGVSSDDLLGYQDALDTLESAKVYSMVPLTQELGIITAFRAQAVTLSTPVEAAWRMALLSTAIPTTQDIGNYNADLVNSNGGNNTITLVTGKYILSASNATFISDGVKAGDLVHIVSATSATSQVGAVQVKTVINNQQVEIMATDTATAVTYYITRNLTKAQQADYVAANSTALGSNRAVHCPNTAGVVVDGVVKYLPGYYFMCGLAGLIAGLPSQQGLTNIAMAGFEDVKMSNFYFTSAQMKQMAAAGTFLVVQEEQGSIPYIRHELTTDMSVYYYREIQAVKNWDYISYFYYDILKSFIGKWNITPDSLTTLRQSITSGARLLQSRKLPKIGAPLVDFAIVKLIQDPDMVDNVICELNIQMPTTMNYISLYLIV